MMRNFIFLGVCLILPVLAGCVTPQRTGGLTIMTAAQLDEPAWIRNGDAIPFEGEEWFPTDEVENILDTEVYSAGTYRDVLFYLEKTDVRPFDRVYTRFGKNRYRAFEQ